VAPRGQQAKTTAILWAERLQDPYVTSYSEAIHDSTAGGTPDCIRLLWSPLKLPESEPLSGSPKTRDDRVRQRCALDTLTEAEQWGRGVRDTVK